MSVIKGSCCCGSIQFQLSAQPEMMATCHCTRCRKVGASTFVFVKKDQLEWIAGRELVARYRPEPAYKYVRCFCQKCGTALGEVESDEDSFPIPANCFDDALEARNRFHEFVKEKPGWYEICDGAKQFDGHPFKS